MIVPKQWKRLDERRLSPDRLVRQRVRRRIELVSERHPRLAVHGRSTAGQRLPAQNVLTGYCEGGSGTVFQLQWFLDL